MLYKYKIWKRERESKVNIKIKHLFNHQEQAIDKTIKSIKSYLDLDELNYYNHKHFAIEMETGTGKTFTFINTIFQLYNNLADKENPDDLRFKKFIILVPRIAIREGIANTFYDFKHYFKTQYNNLQYRVDVYHDGDVSAISNFLNNNDLRILILTKQSFDSKNKILQQSDDNCFGRGTYINQIQATNPVVIIDEPQLNKDFNVKEYDGSLIDLLKPSFVLSYSATPPEEIENDIIYKYTPEQAYNDRQVKRLEYYSVTIGNTINATMELKKTKDKKAEILYNGEKYTLKVGDNFGEKVKDGGLSDYFVGNITNDEVFFTNQTKLSDLIANSANQEDLLRAEINETIKQHKNKNDKLKKHKIKQLSLFFVPRVADFITSKEGEIGIVQKIFKEEYKKIYGIEIKNEQFAYYFSEKDSINKEQEKEMTQMILKEKNKLLSLDNQVEFIFAHTSLGVGWDNSNIFNICFLRNIASEQNKKQFVGRGLRLCVNQKGERVFENKDTDRLNNLTIIGSLQYENFCKQYQKDAGWSGAQNPISDATQKRKVNKISIIDDKYTAQRQKFAQELWRALQPKTNWYIYFNKKQELFDSIKEDLQKINVPDRMITIISGDISGNQNEYNTTQIRQEYNENKLIKDLASENWLTLHEIKKLLDGVDREKIKKNQADWTIKAKEVIRNEIESEVLGLDNVEVKYSKIESVNQENSNFDLKSFEEEDFETTADTEKTKANNENYNNSLYNEVPCDAETEHCFVRSANANNNIKLFIKLPKQTENSKKFHINTPFGSYTPDYAILMNNKNNNLYLVLEVKSQTLDDLKRSFPEQWFKIKCAMKHFEVLGFGDCASIEENCANTFNMSEVLEQINREDNKGKNKFYGVYVPKTK